MASVTMALSRRLRTAMCRCHTMLLSPSSLVLACLFLVTNHVQCATVFSSIEKVGTTVRIFGLSFCLLLWSESIWADPQIVLTYKYYWIKSCSELKYGFNRNSIFFTTENGGSLSVIKYTCKEIIGPKFIIFWPLLSKAKENANLTNKLGGKSRPVQYNFTQVSFKIWYVLVRVRLWICQLTPELRYKRAIKFILQQYNCLKTEVRLDLFYNLDRYYPTIDERNNLFQPIVHLNVHYFVL